MDENVKRAWQGKVADLEARAGRLQHERDLLVACVRSGIVLAPCPTPRQWAEIQAMSLTLLEAIAANGATVSASVPQGESK